MIITQTINLVGYLPPDVSWWPRFTDSDATGTMAGVVRLLALGSALVNVGVFGWLLVSLARAAGRPPDVDGTTADTPVSRVAVADTIGS